MASLIILLVLLPTTLLILRLARWITNYRAALSLKLPILLSPFSWQEPLYMLLGSRLSFLRHLPFSLGAWTQYSQMGWQMHSSYTLHHKLGPAFVIVSPAKNEIILADPTAAEEVVSRWKTWVKSLELYAMFDVFGKNVNSVNGRDWQRHRKITALAFRESNYAVVWNEGIRQTGQMCAVWEKNGEITLKRLMDDAALLAMHVLASAGFGKEYAFDGEGLDDVEDGHQMSYGKSMKTILHNVISVVLLSGVKAPKLFLLRFLQELNVAIADLRKYMVERVEGEKGTAQKGEKQDDLMSTLVRANEAAKNEDGGRDFLSDDELYGNLFIFNLAGYETTAGTLVYALPLLAASPDVQAWVAVEVDRNSALLGKGSYGEMYPKLVRCLPVMHETLRLFSAIQGQARYSGDSAQVLQIRENEYVVPPHTYVTVNYPALHQDAKYWDKDADKFQPQRWVVIDEKSGEEVFTGPPQEDVYYAWSHGPRVCPGKKFSQVEFVSVLASMLIDYRIETARRGSENTEQARMRLLKTVKDSFFNITPKPRRPMDAGIALVKR